MVMKVGHTDKHILLHINIVYPSYTFSFTPILPLVLYDCPLTTVLTKGLTLGREESLYGYITMDRNRKAVPLSNKDPLSSDYPLIGIWVAIADPTIYTKLDHPYILSACIKFLQDQNIKVFLLYIYRKENLLINHIFYLLFLMVLVIILYINVMNVLLL